MKANNFVKLRIFITILKYSLSWGMSLVIHHLFTRITFLPILYFISQHTSKFCSGGNYGDGTTVFAMAGDAYGIATELYKYIIATNN
ncbi:MAG: hypothetical protein IPJ13_14470 [Saprospiraceae bacterium]|nr:hypothetical protein [Saprospiraceae bacterium]